LRYEGRGRGRGSMMSIGLCPGPSAPKREASCRQDLMWGPSTQCLPSFPRWDFESLEDSCDWNLGPFWREKEGPQWECTDFGEGGHSHNIKTVASSPVVFTR
jgi:hypothetical protein